MEVKHLAMAGMIAICTVAGWGGNLPRAYAQTPAAGEDAFKPLAAKLQPFIECLNHTDTPLRQDITQYHEVFQLFSKSYGQGHPPVTTPMPGMPGGLSPDNIFGRQGFAVEENHHGFARDGVIDPSCAGALKTAVTAQPADADLDRVGTTYSEALTKLLPVMKTMTTYYQGGDYRDDKMAKGMELDGQATPLFQTLLAASTEMRTLVEKRNHDIHVAELAVVEKTDGRAYRWHLLNLMLVSRQSVDTITAAAETGIPNLDTVKSAEQDLRTAFDAATAYQEANPDIKTPDGRKPKLYSMLGRIGQVVSQVKGLRRDLEEMRDNKGMVHTIVGMQPGATPIKNDVHVMLSFFNSMIESYNRN